MILDYLIGFVCGLLVMFVALMNIFRRWMIISKWRYQVLEQSIEHKQQVLKELLFELREKETVIDQKKEETGSLLKKLSRSVIYRSFQDILGYIEKYRESSKDLEDIRVNALVKPNHNKWNTVAKDVLDKMNNQVDSVETTINTLLNKA